MSTGQRALVTGGSGFIGRRLVEALLQRGIGVRIATSGAPERIRWAPSYTDIVQADLKSPESLVRASEDCDLVFHVAYQFGGRREEQWRSNVEGTRALAQVAVRNKVRRFVHFSSIAAYGPQPDGDLDEQAPARPNDIYAEIKHHIDQMLLEMYRAQSLPVAILQPTIVYGPRGEAWTTRLLDQVKSSRVGLPASGQGLCNAVFVDDVVSAALLASEHEAAIGQAFLVSYATPVTWGDFYGAYAQMAREQEAVVALDDAEFDREWRRRYGTIPALQRYRRGLERLLAGRSPAEGGGLYLPDPGTRALYAARTAARIDKARQRLGYAPAFDLERGMALTAQWACDEKLI
ncbi:nucleoside-diphosphate-sugar epimerase [Methylovirgula ligni]|uniref:Nucleoside-diphosphate-sugar epimerase n=1 Tax=Methylovirgula ligni TaxID=569860 RepID=A0A3D9YNH2_9HYPH|nr:NAD-dependent epimerase/dehydratase family protein [Methylovirgula ligni]REF84107.1 nucleoside-diphosphate-sugar epimerase [Methylovirgula ligni]